MIITIDNHQNDFELTTISEAAEFFIKKLIPENVRKDMDVYIEIVDGISYGFEDSDGRQIMGSAACENENYELPRDFYIALKRGDQAEMLITLAHELVHVKQSAMEEMTKFIHNGIMYCRYMGYSYPVDSIFDDMPWEQEAYALEMVLVSAWGNR